jgi:hypothetical protein
MKALSWGPSEGPQTPPRWSAPGPGSPRTSAFAGWGCAGRLPTRVLLLALAAWPLSARAQQPASGQDQRVAYVAGLVDAIRGSDPAMLVNTTKYIQVVERNKCQAPEQSLRVGCILEAASRNCRQATKELREQCLRASDVIVTNRLSERFFLPKDVRYQIVSKHRDYRTALARELVRRHAVLVAEFAMSRHFPGGRADSAALAAGIEGYCREIAGTRDLSWQYCAAAVVWFIGTDGGSVKEPSR